METPVPSVSQINLYKIYLLTWLQCAAMNENCFLEQESSPKILTQINHKNTYLILSQIRNIPITAPGDTYLYYPCGAQSQPGQCCSSGRPNVFSVFCLVLLGFFVCFLFLLLVFQDRVSLYSSGCPGTYPRLGSTLTQRSTFLCL